ncbi:tRNA (adenosine(37)-N6)-dimethylallyltransferase MiaA [Arsenophonus symbiont of Ornithomya chloropus]|uniref:tRNA (adenosine(37)-N6)-dimethylallyltransferase MiaA n=1 Tax=Arsenophonus symbiont of Ornithomya chloropus TaxID=634121 RepID=UPI0032B25133
MGPTASGKTELVIELRKKLPIEIISVDSVLIYRGMDIGSAKPTKEDQILAPHRLIDIIEPTQFYSVSDFRRDALLEIQKIIALDRIPLCVGGAMFYFKILLYGLSPLPPTNICIRREIAAQAKLFGWKAIYKRLEKVDPLSAIKINPNDYQRLSRALEVFLISGKSFTELKKITATELPYNVLQFALVSEDRTILHERIKDRFLKMLTLGFEDEVRFLYKRNDLYKDLPALRSVGYHEMWLYLSGEIDYNEMIYRSISATRQLAKNQITWLKKWKNLHIIESNNVPKALNTILYVMNKYSIL